VHFEKEKGRTLMATSRPSLGSRARHIKSFPYFINAAGQFKMILSRKLDTSHSPQA